MDLKELLNEIVNNDELHAKWLNTLSMMENCGARKISASEHSRDVDLIVLKHAAEEARHAYYLKSQIRKTKYSDCKTYAPQSLLAAVESSRYLHRLDTTISRYLKKEFNFSGQKLKYAAYLLVTYAIEVRADALYPVYEEVLKENKSTISVRMIIAEEIGHLEEMINQMNDFFGDWEAIGSFVIELESQLYQDWIKALAGQIKSTRLSSATA